MYVIIINYTSINIVATYLSIFLTSKFGKNMREKTQKIIFNENIYYDVLIFTPRGVDNMKYILRIKNLNALVHLVSFSSLRWNFSNV